MKTYWVINVDKKHRHLSDVIKSIYFPGVSFPFQVKQFGLNAGVVVLPNGKAIAKDFLNLA